MRNHDKKYLCILTIYCTSTHETESREQKCHKPMLFFISICGTVGNKAALSPYAVDYAGCNQFRHGFLIVILLTHVIQQVLFAGNFVTADNYCY